jgi:hypothetical protein
MLRLGLYILAGHDTTLPYDEIWGSSKIPAYDHRGNLPNSVAYNQQVLVLRDYHVLWSTYRHPDTIAPPGPYGLQISGYCSLLNNWLQTPSSQRYLVYFEDLLSNNEVYCEVSNFLGMAYDKEKVDFEFLRTETRRLYTEAGHVASAKQEITAHVAENLRRKITRMVGTDTFDKYLARYAV